MIVRSIAEMLGTDREVHAPNWVSRRILLERDGMGFSLHETTVYAGTETRMCYTNHLEAVYCVEGNGEVVGLLTGKTYQVIPGVVYALDSHDHHVLRAHTPMRLVCVFNPPLKGAETHDENGSYPLLESVEMTRDANDATIS